jgi:signal peptidase I
MGASLVTARAWKISVVASLVLVAGVFVALLGAGFRFYVVETPSMGTTAPVGTLVAVHGRDAYAVGDVISYSRNGRVYTHRVVAVTPQGFTTQGDINGTPDALPVRASEVVGAVTFYGKDLGFVVKALPWLVLAGVLVYVVSLMQWVGHGRRWRFRLVGWSLAASFASLWVRPWVNMVMTGYVAQADGVEMHLVNTGILPLKVLGTVLASGQDAVVTQTMADAAGHYTVAPHLALNSWYFALLLAICLTPLVAALAIRAEQAVPAAAEQEPVSVRRRWEGFSSIGPVALTGTASVVAAVLVLQLSTNAAFAASISNSTDTVGTKTWFTCESAESLTPGALLVWGLTVAGTQTDLTTNAIAGTMRTVNGGTAAIQSSSSPCPHDTQGSLQLNGATCIFMNGTTASSDTYSEEVWFRSTATSLNGLLIGFSDNSTPTTGSQKYFDRHVYLDGAGRVVFGVLAGGAQTVVASPAGTSYADGAWHHVVATSTVGTISLYLDGALVATRVNVAAQAAYKGDWMVGCGVLAGWPDATGTSRAFPAYYTGNLRLAAVYGVALSASQVKDHYLAGQA